MYLFNIATAAKASRIRLRAIWSCFQALEQQVNKTSRQNASYAEELTGLSIRYEDAIEQQRLSKLQLSQLLQSVKAATRWPEDADDEKAKEHGTMEDMVGEESAVGASRTDAA